ncbi:hypothetical protein H8S90_20050 [Olivibacter sp. SDN3]|uniref:hypothetical protein n=1 Tax=Olivibacter sp. SDN3 TaxID=2764720 RepID=UPI001650F93A|nr:hypothetical protein [Olivibacter sp. SDN3]QNL49020.1 hypothetical protein H8S90_20050 [Olivibacter sp. SDN3]
MRNRKKMLIVFAFVVAAAMLFRFALAIVHDDFSVVMIVVSVILLVVAMVFFVIYFKE